MLPTLAVIKQEKTTDYIVGLDELGGEDFATGGCTGVLLCAAGVAWLGFAAPRWVLSCCQIAAHPWLL